MLWEHFPRKWSSCRNELILAVFPNRGATSSRGFSSFDKGAGSLAPSSCSAGTVMMGNTMVGAFSSAAFAHNELLAGCLAGCTVPGSAALSACFDSSLVSVSVVKSQKVVGIFECALITTEVQ